MNVDLKEKEGLTQIDHIFYSEVKQSVINVVSDNPDLDEVRLREKILEIIVKYFDKTIGIEKLGVMLSARGCFSDPVRFLEDSKRKYLAYYSTHPIPLVNSKATLQKIAVIAEELDFSNIIVTNERQIAILKNCKNIISQALESIEASMDILAMQIKSLWNELGKITGESENERIIDLIFSKFCLGK